MLVGAKKGHIAASQRSSVLVVKKQKLGNEYKTPSLMHGQSGKVNLPRGEGDIWSAQTFRPSRLSKAIVPGLAYPDLGHV